MIKTLVWVAAFAVAIRPALAADDFWNNPSGGVFSTGGNWVDGSAAGSNDVAHFSLPDTYIVQWTPSVGNVTNQRLNVPAGDVTFLASGGNFTYRLENPGENLGLANLNGGRVVLGALSGASLLLDATNVFRVDGNSSLEVGFGSRIMTQRFQIGVSSDGTSTSPAVTVRDGARIDTDALEMGNFMESFSSLQIDGVGSTVSAGHILLGRGAIEVTNGAVLTTTSSVSVGFGRLGAAYVNIGSTGGAPATWDASSITLGDTSLTGTENPGNLTIGNGNVTAGSITVQQGSSLEVKHGALTTSNLILNGGHLSLSVVPGNQAVINVTNPFGTLRLAPSSFPSGNLFIGADQQLHVAGETVVEAGTRLQVFGNNSFTSSALINHGRVEVLDNQTIGNATTHGSYTGNGGLFVYGNLTIHDAGFADLGYLSVIQLGTLNAPNGVAVPAGGDLIFQSSGFVNGKLSTAIGSSVAALSQQMVTLGDTLSVAGIAFGGELRVNESHVVLHDANLADLGTLTTLGREGMPGTLEANNGALIDSADNITGYGIVDTPNDPFKPMVVNGQASGKSPIQQLTFTGYVKGVGMLDNVSLTGTHSPGLGIATLEVGNVTYSETSTLLIEMSPHAGFDKINTFGSLQLAGTLEVGLTAPGGFTAGQSFEILRASNGITGQFDTLFLPYLGAGLDWGVAYTIDTMSLHVISSATGGDFDDDGDVDGRDFLAWQRDPSVGDLADWQAGYGNGGLIATHTSIPEPQAVLLVIACLPAYLGRYVAHLDSCRDPHTTRR